MLCVKLAMTVHSEEDSFYCRPGRQALRGGRRGYKAGNGLVDVRTT